MYTIFIGIQESLSRQRALEAVERELTFHLLDVSTIINEEKRLIEASNSGTLNIDNVAVDGVMAKRFSTKVWDNTEIYRYLLELNPEVAPSVELYYETIIKGTNRMLEESNNYYTKLYEPCKPFYSILTGNKPQDINYCSLVAQRSIQTQSDIAYSILKHQEEVKQKFHPTKDRLNSLWLRFLLGTNSVNILK